MQRNFNVALDPATEINHCIGSKTALSMLPACFINPGDITLMTVPGYPVAGTHTGYYGGTVYKLPLLQENNFFPDLDGIPADVVSKAKLLVINYPNSPTGKLATKAFFEKVVQFAKENNIVVVQDAAHVLLTFDGEPMSFLETPGARDVGVEVHSLSKGFDMIGWRIGWVCGNPLLVQAFSDVKDNCDSDEYHAALLFALTKSVETFIPDLVLYVAGVDTHINDSLGRLNIDNEGLLNRDLTVLSYFKNRSIPVATVIGGGYSKDKSVGYNFDCFFHRIPSKI